VTNVFPRQSFTGPIQPQDVEDNYSSTILGEIGDARSIIESGLEWNKEDRAVTSFTYNQERC
jgi:hypothetical protein